MKQEIRTDKFNTGNYAQKEASEPVDKFTNRPKMKNSGLKDHLMEAFRHGPPVLPSDNHEWSHSKTPQARGAHYTPAGEFGRTERVGAGRGVYGYGGNVHSASSSNAVPGNQDRRDGQNAVGSAPNRRGMNAVGSPPNRRGPNAVGNAPERFGENALASKFKPNFSKPHGHRV